MGSRDKCVQLVAVGGSVNFKRIRAISENLLPMLFLIKRNLDLLVTRKIK